MVLVYVGGLNRPVGVRAVHGMGKDWWAVDAEDTWPGMVMDLRRLGFESMASGEEVLLREGMPAYEPQMDGPAELGGLKPFPFIHPTIQIRRQSYSVVSPDVDFPDECDKDDVEEVEGDEMEPDDDLQYE